MTTGDRGALTETCKRACTSANVKAQVFDYSEENSGVRIQGKGGHSSSRTWQPSALVPRPAYEVARPLLITRIARNFAFKTIVKMAPEYTNAHFLLFAELALEFRSALK